MPIWEKRNQLPFQEKLQREMARVGLDAMLLILPENIYYSTGYASNFAYITGEVGRTVAVVPAEGKCGVVCGEFEKLAAESCGDIEVNAYPMWMYIEDYCRGREKMDIVPDLNKTFRIAMEMLNLRPGAKLGIEYAAMPHTKFEYLAEVVGRENLVDCMPAMVECRKIKTPWEIEVMREAARVDDTVMRKIMPMIDVGMTECEVANLFHRLAYEESKELTNVVQVHTLGADFSPVMIFRHKPLQPGDICRLDGSTNVACYSSDIARTFAVGGSVLPERQHIFDTLLRAQDKAFSMIGPGVPFADVFNEMQKFISSEIPGFIRGHYGHSLGCGRDAEELPRISTMPGCFEPNMIFCVEFPYYSSRNHNYNIEDEILITENGIEQLTFTNRSLFVK